MMTRRNLLAAATAGGLAASTSAPASNKPNVILIVADDLGCRDVGCYGASDLKTPNLDAMAATGALFDNWYSNAPVCAPARAAILSGRFPAKAGVANNGKPMTAGIANFGSTLKANGYATAAIGKWHLGSDAATCPNGHGFDYFYGFHSGCVDFFSHRYYWGEPRLANYHDLWRNRTEIFEDGQYLTERIAAEAVQFIHKQKRTPFAAYVAFNAPHYPMHAPAKYVSRFASLSPERRIYAAMIAAVDDGVGEIRRALREDGLLDNTIMIFVGDNGATTEKRAGLNQEYATGGRNGQFRGFKFSLFDGGMHVPAMMSWPAKIPAGQKLGEQVMSMDILPTLCRATGSKLPDGAKFDGSDILDVVTSKAKSPHKALFWSQGGQLAVRRDEWKLVIDGRVYDRKPEGSKPLTGEDAMFLSNLVDDPGESKNLRRLHPNIVDELATLVQQWHATLPKE